MSGKIPYVFRQNTDFLYLTGCLESECVLVITIKPGNENFEAVLFMPQHDSHVSTLKIKNSNEKYA
jgi:Xaa-Pro aminopeptidase